LISFGDLIDIDALVAKKIPPINLCYKTFYSRI